MKQTCYTIYGMLVDPGDLTFAELKDDPGQCANNGRAGYFQAGRYGNAMTFLALNWREVEPGEYVMHPGDRPHATKEDRNRWNEALRKEADRLELRVVDGPGWFTIPDEY